MTKYKYFIFSDTHGCFDILFDNLADAGFNFENKNHILIGAGDYFDRGPQCAEIYEFLTTKKFKGRVYVIRGNHDDMILDFMDKKGNSMFNCLHNGMDSTIESFSKVSFNYSMLQNDPDFYINLINEHYPKFHTWLSTTLKNGFQIDNYKITHAGLRNITTGDDNEPEWIIDNWAKTPYFVADHKPDGYTYIFGHWHAKQLRKIFGYEINDETFEHKHFIGIDARTNASYFVNIYTIESDQLPTELK